MGDPGNLREQLDQGLSRLLEGRGLGPLLGQLQQEGAWLVGGLVRDLCLGREVQDVDLAVPAGADAVCRRVRQRHGGTLVPLDEARGIFRLVLSPELYLDIANFQGSSLAEDLARRDFTVNAMALPPGGAARDLVDPHGGLGDLAAGVLRMVSAGSFHSDPLRILRAARLGARLGLAAEPATCAAMEQAVSGLGGVAMERIHAELEMLLQTESALGWLERLQAIGAFQPLLAASGMKRFRGAVGKLEPAGEGSPLPAGEGSLLPVLAGVWPQSSSLELRWAALAHDLAGPQLNGRQAGALFAHLRVPARTGRRAAAVYTTPQVLEVPEDPAAVVRALLFLGPEVREGLLLARVLGHPRAEMAQELYRQHVEPREGQAPLVSGKDLLRAGLQAGPGLGRLLEEIEVRWRLGQFGSAQEAIAWAVAGQEPRGRG